MKPRLVVTLVALALVLMGQGYASGVDLSWPGLQPGPEATKRSTTAGVVPARPDVPGYDRSCKSGHSCVFGPAWSDDVDVQWGHNGCDQRSDLMRDKLAQVELKAGTNGCVVARGVLHDLYTGRTVTYERAGNTEVVADHVVPLAAAWDLGAAQWTPAKRRDFANDPRNLILTTRSANLAKSDKTPGEWMPARGLCQYATTYLEVAAAYGVALTMADEKALSSASRSC